MIKSFIKPALNRPLSSISHFHLQRKNQSRKKQRYIFLNEKNCTTLLMSVKCLGWVFLTAPGGPGPWAEQAPEGPRVQGSVSQGSLALGICACTWPRCGPAFPPPRRDGRALRGRAQEGACHSAGAQCGGANFASIKTRKPPKAVPENSRPQLTTAAPTPHPHPHAA